MKFKWYGTATLLIESENTRILIDPYIRRNKKLPPPPTDETATADAVLITHPHLDHFMDIGLFLKAGIPVCYVSQGGIDRIQKRGADVTKMKPYKAGDELKIGNVTVRAYQSRHCKFDAGTLARIALSPRTYFMLPRTIELLREMKTFKMSDDEICALELSDGEKTVMVLGSAGVDESVRYPMGADLMIFPYQGRTRMHKYMIPVLKKFEPKAVTIDHHDNAFPPFSHKVNTKKFIKSVAEALPDARAFLPKENEWIEV